MPGHQACPDGEWAPDELIEDDQALVLNDGFPYLRTPPPLHRSRTASRRWTASHTAPVRLHGKHEPLTAPKLSHWHTHHVIVPEPSPRTLSSDRTPLTVSQPGRLSSVAPGDPGYRADQRDERADREPAESR